MDRYLFKKNNERTEKTEPELRVKNTIDCFVKKYGKKRTVKGKLLG